MQDPNKENWLKYLHNLRRRTIEIIFKNYKHKYFISGLEMGAGEGFQSKLLSEYVVNLTSTDYNSSILKLTSPDIFYKVCDAEIIDEYFPHKSFDLIYSSNLLEHIYKIDQCLSRVHNILKDDGLTIHCIPSVFLKFCNIFFYYPHLIRLVFRALFQKNGFQILRQKYRNESGIATDENYIENNPKTKQKSSNILKFILPQVHGVSGSNIQEFWAFKKNTWIKIFNRNGFKVVSMLKGPAFSGYNFNFNYLRKWFERLGFTSENIFICRKEIKSISN